MYGARTGNMVFAPGGNAEDVREGLADISMNIEISPLLLLHYTAV